MDRDQVIYLLLKSDWLCKKSRFRLQRSQKSLARSDRFILETVGRVVQFDTDHRDLTSEMSPIKALSPRPPQRWMASPAGVSGL